MSEKRFTVDKFIEDYKSHIIDNEGRIETLSEFVEYLNKLTEENRELKEENQQLRELLEYGLEVSQVEIDEELRRIKND